MSQDSPLVRSLGVALSLLGGVLVGAVATTYHAALIPFGTIAAVLLVVLYLAGLRVAVVSRAPATAGALGVVASVVALAGFDGGRSVLIAANTVGLSFLAGVTIATLVILAWPRVSASPTSYDKEAVRVERNAP